MPRKHYSRKRSKKSKNAQKLWKVRRETNADVQGPLQSEGVETCEEIFERLLENSR